MLGAILRFVALAAASAEVGNIVDIIQEKLMAFKIGGVSPLINSIQGGDMAYYADLGGGGSTTWGPGAMGPAAQRKKRRRRARLTQGELTELMNIKNLLGKTAAANVLPFYMGRGR